MRYFLLLIFLSTGSSVFSQKINSTYQLRIARANSAIQIDGNTDEAAWAAAEPAKDFYMISPMDTSNAKVLGTNVSVIPYVLGGFTSDYENNKSAKFKKEIGADFMQI